MAITYSTQASIAFKNLLGKSITDTNKGVNNEAEGIFFNIDSNNIWIDYISPTPSVSISNGVCVFVKADLVLDNTSNNKAYFAVWPSNPPNGIDPTTLLPYTYGRGLLSNINPGDRVRNSIPPSYGIGYEAKPYSTGNVLIPPGDPRNWIFQYNSGIFFQQDVVGPTPESIELYVYTGKKLSDQIIFETNNFVRVSALGVDNYIGTATPSISTYSSFVYLIDFENSNTGTTPVTINIDNIGTYEIIKFDEYGNPISLTASGEIIPNKIYYLIWDGQNFQLYLDNPKSTNNLLYTNLIGSIEVGGIPAGTTFSNATMKDMWDALLKPSYLQSNFTSFDFNHGGLIREVGNPILAGTYTFIWTTTYPYDIKPNSITIKDLTNNIILANNIPNTGSYDIYLPTINKSIPSIHQWKAYGIRNNNSSFYSSTLTIKWLWRIYYDTHSNETLTETDVQSLNNKLSENRLGDYTFSTGGYKYFAWPTSFGAPILFKDYNTNLSVAMAGIEDGYTMSVGNYYAQIISITNTWGYTTDYYIFRTKNILNGPIIISVL